MLRTFVSKWMSLAFAGSIVIFGAGVAAGGQKGGGHDGGGFHDGRDSGSSHGGSGKGSDTGGSKKGADSGGKQGGSKNGGDAGGNKRGSNKGGEADGSKGGSKKGNDSGGSRGHATSRGGGTATDRGHHGKHDENSSKRPGETPKRSSARKAAVASDASGRADRFGKARQDSLEPGSSGPDDFSGSRLMSVEAVVTAAIAASTVSPGAFRPAELPLNLRPHGEKNYPTTNVTEPPPGVPAEIVRACHSAIESAAASYGATRVRVTSGGSVHQLSPDTFSAPIEVSIDYARLGGVETRQAPITCELDARQTVIGLT